MQRIHQKIGRALFGALAVSMLLGACDSPNTPTPNPGNGQQGQQGQKGGSGSGGGTSSSGAISGGGSYSSTKDPLTPEGKALHDDPGTNPGGGIGGGTPTETTVKVTVKSVQAGLAGHAQVKNGGSVFEAAGLEVTVDKAADDAGFVDAVLEKLAAEVKSKSGTAPVEGKEAYKFTDDAAGTTAVTANKLTTANSEIYVSIFKTKVSVKVETITAFGNYLAVGAPYNSTQLVENVSIALNTTPADYMVTIKKALAEEIASTLDSPDAEGGAPYCFFKEKAQATDIDESDIDASKTIYVAKKKKVQVKITLNLGGATNGAVNKVGHALNGKTVVKPTSGGDGAVMVTAVTASGKTEMSAEVYEITEDVFKGVAEKIMKIITDAPGELGVVTTKYALFTQQASDTDGAGYIAGLDYAALSQAHADFKDLKIYIGYISN